MRKNSVKKRVAREEQVGVWVYVLLLTAVTILGWVLGNFDFSVGKTTLTIAIFAYPFRYFIANIITKKYGYKETFNAISYSACLLLFFAIVANILGQQEIDYVPLTGEILGYLASQVVNLVFYYYIFINTDSNKFALLATYILAMLMDNFISMLFSSRMILADSFWRTYFVTIIIEGIISAGLIFLDHKKIRTTRKIVH